MFNDSEINDSIKNNKERFKYEVGCLHSSGSQLALHYWISHKSEAVIFYIHGVQSHAGWLHEFASWFSSRNITICVLDRRGSGLSEGVRGDMPNMQLILNDYYRALVKIKKRFSDIPLILFGQSLGGSILAGLVAMPFFDINFDKIIFSASAFGKRYAKYSPNQINRIHQKKAKKLIKIDILDEDYTDDQKYLDFIKNDNLCYRYLTTRSISTLLNIEAAYLLRPGILAKFKAAYIHPMIDPLVDLPQATAIFQSLAGNHGIVKSFAIDKHYLFFTKVKYEVFSWMYNFIMLDEIK